MTSDDSYIEYDDCTIEEIAEEPFTLLIDDNRFIAYCSYIRFVVNFDDYTIKVVNDEL